MKHESKARIFDQHIQNQGFTIIANKNTEKNLLIFK